jgi:hypothetical protein
MTEPRTEPVRQVTEKIDREWFAYLKRQKEHAAPSYFTTAETFQMFADLAADKARADAASEMCRDLQASVDGMARERLALEQRIQELEARENG